MDETLRILIAEDYPADAELLEREISKFGIKFTDKIVENEADFINALNSFNPDIILSDYLLPQINGMEILLLKQKLVPDLPFILVTGAVNEETAVSVMKAGADDYILKQSLNRVGPAIRSALEKRAIIKAKAESEKALIESEQRYKRITESITDYIYTVFIVDGKVLKTVHGPGCVGITGYKPDEFERDNYLWFRMVSPEFRTAVENQAKMTLNLENPESLEHIIIRKDGNKRWIKSTIVPRYDSNGILLSYDGLVQDITERKQAEEALMESEERFRTMADTAPVMIWMSGLDRECFYFNKTWLDFTGKKMETEVGDGWAEGVHPDDLNGCIDTYFSSFDARHQFQMEYRLKRNDGEYRWILDHGVPRFNPEGQFYGYIGSCIDITERREAELERIQLIGQLEETITQNKLLSGLLPICSWCKKIKNEDGTWQVIDRYVAEHTDAQFSHGICPDCRDDQIRKHGKG